MIITISGTPGSGKSTIAKILVNKLNMERLYVGRIMRELCRQKDIQLLEGNAAPDHIHILLRGATQI